MAWRYYAQRALGGLWLDRDLELFDTSVSWALSGPGTLTAKVDSQTARQVALDGLLTLEEWSTAIFAENDGEIRWGGLLHSSSGDEGGVRSLDCIGYSGYPKGRIYNSNNYRLWEADPFDVVRVLWEYVQGQDNSNLNVIVDGHAAPEGMVIGDPSPGPRPERGQNEPKKDFDARLLAWQNYAGTPYELAWWNQQDCGDEIDNVLTEVGAEYVEAHSWADLAKTTVRHGIRLGTPYIGTRRDDLRFVEGENIFVPPNPERNGSEYANQVVVLGAGEERHTLREEAGFVEKGRLRRDKTLGAKDVLRPKLLKAMAEDELHRSRDMLKIDSFEVMDHPHAPFGSFAVGDEIRVRTYSGFENIDVWVRITELTVTPDSGDTISLSVRKL